MPNIAVLLKQEIHRVSRRATSAELSALRKASAQQRRDVAALRRQVAALGRQVATLARGAARAVQGVKSTGKVAAARLRFSAKGLRAQRKRLALSAGDFGRLVGTSAQSVYNWEQERATPRSPQMAAIARLRGMGKREARARLGGE